MVRSSTSFRTLTSTSKPSPGVTSRRACNSHDADDEDHIEDDDDDGGDEDDDDYDNDNHDDDDDDDIDDKMIMRIHD